MSGNQENSNSSNNNSNSNSNSSNQEDSPLTPTSALKKLFSTKGKLVAAILKAGGGDGKSAKDLGKDNTRAKLDAMAIGLNLHVPPGAAGGAVPKVAVAAAPPVVVATAAAAAAAPAAVAPKTAMAPPAARPSRRKAKKKKSPPAGPKFATQAQADAAAAGGGPTITRTFVTGNAGEGGGGGGGGGKKVRRKVKTKKRWKKGDKRHSYLQRGTYAVPKGASASTKSFIKTMRSKQSKFPKMKQSARVQLVGPRALPSHTSWTIPVAHAPQSVAVAAPPPVHPQIQPQSVGSHVLQLQAPPTAAAAAAAAAVPMVGVTQSPQQAAVEILTIPVTNTTAGNVVIRGSYLPPSTPGLRYGDINTYKLCADVATGLDMPLGPGMSYPVQAQLGTSLVLVGYPAGNLQTVLELPSAAAADGSVTAIQWTGTTMGVERKSVSIRGSKRARSPSPKSKPRAPPKSKRRKKGGKSKRRRKHARKKRRTRRRRRRRSRRRRR